MNIQEFNNFAKKFGCDVYGEAFNDGGYGLYLLFDIADALFVWSKKTKSEQEIYEINNALIDAKFKQSPLFSIDKYFSNNDENSTSIEIYKYIEDGNFGKVIKVFTWAVNQNLKNGGMLIVNSRKGII